MNKLKNGYIQVYTGNGKGKTTAAMGLALRALGDGMTVYVVQFLKSWQTGEVKSLKFFQENFKIFRFDKVKGFTWNLNQEELEILKQEIKKAYNFVEEILKLRSCDILILDEIMGTLKNGFLTEEEVLKLMDLKPDNMELILTGRNVPNKILEKADLVTEMKNIKHYYEKGVNAREGIEF